MSQGRNAMCLPKRWTNTALFRHIEWLTMRPSSPGNCMTFLIKKNLTMENIPVFFGQLDAWFWGVKSSWEMNSKLRFQAHPSCAKSPRKPIFGGSLFDHQSYPLTIMGSQNWWFGDPRPLLYTSKTLYSRVQWFLGPVILRILGF